MVKEKSVILSFKHRPPLTITMIGAILLMFMSNKEQIIDSLPISNEAVKEALGAWYMWVFKVLGTLFGILQIALGVKKDDNSQYQGVADKINTDDIKN